MVDGLLYEAMNEFVRASIFQRKPCIREDYVVDWDGLMDISSAHGLIAMVWDGICMLPRDFQPTRGQRINWGLSAQEVWSQYNLHKRVLSEIIDKCKSNNIKLLLMKGICLSDMYPKPECRLSGDIDFFLCGDFDKGNKVLANNDYAFSGKHACFTYKGVPVENHQNFFYHGTDIQKRVDDYLIASTGQAVLTQRGYYVLPTTASLVHLLLHSLVHLNNPDEHIVLKNIFDFAYFLFYNKKELNPRSVAIIMRSLGLEKAFDLFLQLSEWALSVDFTLYREPLHEKSPDFQNAVSLLTNDSLREPKFDQHSFIKQLRQRFRYEKQTSWKYNYLSNSRVLNSGLFKSQFAVLVKSLLKIPFNQSIKDGLKGNRL